MSASRRSRAPARSACAPVFAALGDGTRLSLVAQLTGGRRRSITELASGASMTRQAISKHLTVLEKAGIVRRTRRGRESLFVYEPRAVDEVRAYLDRVAQQWEAALGRLKAFVEG